jgi:hypothetical protein
MQQFPSPAPGLRDPIRHVASQVRPTGARLANSIRRDARPNAAWQLRLISLVCFGQLRTKAPG